MLLSERYVVTNLPSFNSQAYDLFIELSSIKSKPSGILSVISFAKPANVPSLYILIVYVTISPTCTDKGVFVCLYVAVVIVLPFSSVVPNFDVSTTGSLTYVPSLFFNSSSFNDTMNFLNAKSKFSTINFSKSSSSS